MSASFFEPDGDGFLATAHTRGPWDPTAQHGGPPAALLARAVEARLPEGFRLARLCLDMLRPVPIGRVRPRVEMAVGRQVARATVTLEADGRPVVSGTALAMRQDTLDLPATSGDPRPGPAAGQPMPFFPVPGETGFHHAISSRFLRGSWIDTGPAHVWFHSELPLVAGEDLSGAQRAVLVADAGSGVSAVVDFTKFTFVNADLTVHLHRVPEGAWIGVDARSVVQPDGTGLTTTVLHDELGPVGSALQALVIRPR
jgi:hypothetical protein